jgi:hypothetical protein
MPIEQLLLENSSVKTLAAVKGMPLRWLNICRTEISDVTPLRDSPMETMYWEPNQIEQGMDVLRAKTTIANFWVPTQSGFKLYFRDNFWAQYDARKLQNQEGAEPMAPGYSRSARNTEP